MVLLIDNYDSFTYNLYQYLGSLVPEVRVVRNDQIDLEGILALNPTHVVVSPGPGYPADAGISVEAVRLLGHHCPVLGVCLGHQAIGEAFGANVVRAPDGPVHGKASAIRHARGCPVFEGLPDEVRVGRYHSLVVDRESLPDCLEITAETADGLVMGLRHRDLPVYGLQFHPESILTEEGMRFLENFLRIGKPSVTRESMPGGKPGALSDGKLGAVSGGMPGAVPGGKPGALPGGKPGALPGGKPGAVPMERSMA